MLLIFCLSVEQGGFVLTKRVANCYLFSVNTELHQRSLRAAVATVENKYADLKVVVSFIHACSQCLWSIFLSLAQRPSNTIYKYLIGLFVFQNWDWAIIEHYTTSWGCESTVLCRIHITWDSRWKFPSLVFSNSQHSHQQTALVVQLQNLMCES